MDHNLKILKFGGSSLADPERIKAVASIIAAERDSTQGIVAVVSAMGDTTNALISLAHEVSDNPDPRELDMLVTTGERVSMALLSMALQGIGVDSVSLTGSQSGILTDGVHGDASIVKILGTRIMAGLSQRKVVIVAGYQGYHPETGDVTTLGRGGTDLSAVALAHTLGASRCVLFKDVPGVFSADPRYCSRAIHFSEVSYSHLVALAEAGSPLIHRRAALFAQEKAIPLEIRSSFEPNTPGTVVIPQPTSDSWAVVMNRRATDIEFTFIGKDRPPPPDRRLRLTGSLGLVCASDLDFVSIYGQLHDLALGEGPSMDSVDIGLPPP